MNEFILLINLVRLVVFVKTFYEIWIHFLKPLYFLLIKKFKVHQLHDKNITPNINSSKRKIYIHKKETLFDACILFVLLFDTFQK
uniref:hypothetical protein n=1 Tax=Milkweed yellows phytoplasma TaxID=208434 RepID=UPI000363D811|nr:hypothetical protein [Milkweed yellows phytoplasma]